MATGRPAIPEPTKRAVRQRCGFGCIFDGNPVIQYDHMEPYEVVKRHDADNITLLCPGCHAEKTAGRLPGSVVVAADKDPYCRRSAYTAGHRWVPRLRGPVRLRMGGNWFEYEPSILAVEIDRITIVALERDEDGVVQLWLQLLDHANRPLLLIEHSELVVNTNNWDVQYVGQTLKIRTARGAIAAEIVYSQDEVTVRRGQFFANGVRLEILPLWLTIYPRHGGEPRGAVTGTLFQHPAALSLGVPGKLPAAIRMTDV